MEPTQRELRDLYAYLGNEGWSGSIPVVDAVKALVKDAYERGHVEGIDLGAHLQVPSQVDRVLAEDERYIDLKGGNGGKVSDGSQ